jgi:hypothetical protein
MQQLLFSYMLHMSTVNMLHMSIKNTYKQKSHILLYE